MSKTDDITPERIDELIVFVNDCMMSAYGEQRITSSGNYAAILTILRERRNNPLPWVVTDRDGDVLGRFPFQLFADCYRGQVWWNESRKPLTITGPADEVETTTP